MKSPGGQHTGNDTIVSGTRQPTPRTAQHLDTETSGSTGAATGQCAAPLGKLLRPSLGFTALVAHSGTPPAS